MRFVVVFFACIGCGRGSNRAPSRESPPARPPATSATSAPPVDATTPLDPATATVDAAFDTVPSTWTSQGSLTTSVVSGPRASWPCKLEGTLQSDITDGAQPIEQTYSYDKAPATCRVPVDQAAEGVIGCPTLRMFTNRANGLSLEFRYRYDAKGRLIKASLGRSWTTYTWEGNEVRGSRADDDQITKPGVLDELRVVDGEVHVLDALGDTSLRVWLRDGHVAFSERGTIQRTFSWDGPRLVEIRHHGSGLNETSILRATPCN